MAISFKELAKLADDGIIGQDRLMSLAGLKRGQKAALRRHLRKAAIPFRELNGNIFTTQTALDAAMVGRGKKKNEGPNLEALKAWGNER